MGRRPRSHKERDRRRGGGDRRCRRVERRLRWRRLLERLDEHYRGRVVVMMCRAAVSAIVVASMRFVSSRRGCPGKPSSTRGGVRRRRHRGSRTAVEQTRERPSAAPSRGRRIVGGGIAPGWKTSISAMVGPLPTAVVRPRRQGRGDRRVLEEAPVARDHGRQNVEGPGGELRDLLRCEMHAATVAEC